MGPYEWVVGLLKPLLDMVGVPPETIFAAAGNVIGYVSFAKRALKKHGLWLVWTIAGVASVLLALPFWGNWGAMIVTAVATFAASAGMLFLTGKGGSKAGKMVPLSNPSKNPG